MGHAATLEVVLTRMAAIESQQRQLLSHQTQQTLLLNAILQKVSSSVDDALCELPDGIMLPLRTVEEIEILERKLTNPDILKRMVSFCQILVFPTLELQYYYNDFERI